MSDSVEETLNTIAEDVTNTRTPEASAAVLISWFANAFREIAGADNPAATAQAHADAVEANRNTLAAAVAANPN